MFLLLGVLLVLVGHVALAAIALSFVAGRLTAPRRQSIQARVAKAIGQ
jgi:hypothetical protein